MYGLHKLKYIFSISIYVYIYRESLFNTVTIKKKIHEKNRMKEKGEKVELI